MSASISTARSNISLPHPIIALGRDDRGKAHASYFPATDAHLASKAAGLMGMLALQADTDGVRAFLPNLPKGKLFDSGKAFVPFVKQDLYKEIASHLPDGDRLLLLLRLVRRRRSLTGKDKSIDGEPLCRNQTTLKRCLIQPQGLAQNDPLIASELGVDYGRQIDFGFMA
jgi:hypothetical protein